MNVIRYIIKDSEYLSRLSEDFENIDNIDDISYLKIGIKNFNNIIKLYRNNYDFDTEELLILLEDLKFIGSSKIDSILIIIKDRNVNEQEINKYLRKEYNDIELQDTLFLTLIYYNIIEALPYHFNNKNINEGIKICINRDN